jgi:hypothetical protein
MVEQTQKTRAEKNEEQEERRGRFMDSLLAILR